MFPALSTQRPLPPSPRLHSASDRVGVNKVRGDAVGTDRSDDHHRGCAAVVHRCCRPHLDVLLHSAGKWGPQWLGLTAGLVKPGYGRRGLYFWAPKECSFRAHAFLTDGAPLI